MCTTCTCTCTCIYTCTHASTCSKLCILHVHVHTHVHEQVLEHVHVVSAPANLTYGLQYTQASVGEPGEVWSPQTTSIFTPGDA